MTKVAGLASGQTLILGAAGAAVVLGASLFGLGVFDKDAAIAPGNETIETAVLPANETTVQAPEGAPVVTETRAAVDATAAGSTVGAANDGAESTDGPLVAAEPTAQAEPVAVEAPDVAVTSADAVSEPVAETATTDPVETTEAPVATDAAPTDATPSEDTSTELAALAVAPAAANVANAAVSEPATAPAVALPQAPRFDIVRVEPDGTTLIAGSAVAASEIDILLDETVLDSVVAGRDGKFVAFVTVEPSPQPRLLALMLRIGDHRIRSTEQVIIAPAPIAVAELEQRSDQGTEQSSEQNPAKTAETAVQTAGTAGAENPVVETAAVATNSVETETAAVSAAEVQPETSAASVAETVVAQATETVNSAVAPGVEPVAEATSDLATTAVSAEGAVAPATSGVAEPTPIATAEPKPVTTTETATAASEPTSASVAVAMAKPEPTAEATPAAAATPVVETARTQVAAPVAAPVVIMAGQDGVKVVQPAQQVGDPATLSELILDAISYSDTGAVELNGRGQFQHFVRAYLDNKLIEETQISAQGQWSMTLSDVAAGLYTLRLDQLDQDGKVTSRVATPFKREAEEKLAAVQQATQATAASNAAATNTASDAPKVPPVRVVTVQPGNTLWAIARSHYGEGVLYVRVFEANKDLILDPDLIYPGQIFTVPN